jgi:hypothetical protein
MNAPTDIAKVLASPADKLHGYKSFKLGSFNFRRDEYFAHIGWTTRDGRPLSHTMDIGNFLRALMRDVASIMCSARRITTRPSIFTPAPTTRR